VVNGTPIGQADRLILFGRYPIPGQTKTRLIPVLGPAGAAELQRRLTERTLKTARTAAFRWGAALEVRFDGGSTEKMRRWLGPAPVFTSQGPGDLGERMGEAILGAFQSGCKRVVLFGTDIPGLGVHHLGEALESLVKNDLVLGPTDDGGYCLVGLRRPADIFRNISWGREDVLERTVARATAQGLSIRLLEPLMDIDTEEELMRVMPGPMRPYLSVVVPALNERDHIEETIRRARDRDAEIVVVDGGSEDDTAAKARKAGAKVITGARGRATQQNSGARAARGDVLLFLHADTRLPEDYVSRVFGTLLDRRVVAGAFRFKTDLQSPLIRTIEWAANLRSRYLGLSYGDQGLFMRRPSFEAAGGFPAVPVAEDLLLVRRLSRFGRVATVSEEAVTSGRRWREIGPLRTLFINQVILFGLAIGVSPRVLASMYRSAGVCRRGLKK